MKNSHQIGDTTTLQFTVTDHDTATFDTGEVHPVYATFALGRDAEWTTRQFVLNMKEADEEGIGTFLNIKHHSPALLNSVVTITGIITAINGHEIICSFEAKVHDRIIATGETGQKILKKERLEKLFAGL
ncbi:MAG: hypothetical protein SGJ10_05690 [Bacteroidota bacterium]|nr:hypothetical protein [Bacteroidota bacterium]